MVNKKRVIKTIQRLIAINSENPPGNEAKATLFVKGYLRRLGLKVKVYEFKKGRPNVLGYLPGNNPRHTILITPHLDTVPAGKNWSVNPFSGKIIKDKIYGLGATDCKGNLACALEAINSIVEDNKKPNCNVIFAATVDEETGSRLGLIPLLNKGLIKVDSALVLDADNFDIIVAQKGLIHLRVKIEGKRAHGAYPWRGINAIDIALKIIKDIKEEKFSYRRNTYLILLPLI